MKRQLIAIVAILLISLSESDGQVLPFTQYTPDRELNALPSAEVHEVFQDQLGYIWFSIYSSGLVRYNGVFMEHYGTGDGLRDLTVWDLIEDATGRLWVSSNAGLVFSEKPLATYMAGERIKFISGTEDVSIHELSVNHNRMTIDNDGWLWVGTENLGIIRYRFKDNNKLESDTLSTNPTDNGEELSVRALTAGRDGSVWVSLLNGDILRFENEQLVNTYQTGSDNNTNALYESPGGVLWGGEQDGRIWQLEELGSEVHFIEVSNNLNSNIANITSDSEGTIWISSEGSGLMKIEPATNIETIFTRSNGLLGEIVYNVLEDSEKNIWIAQSGGVSKLRYNFKAFTNLTSFSLAGEKPLLPSSSVNSVLPVAASQVNKPCVSWAATTEGGIACINSNFESVYVQQADGLTANWVNGLAYDTSERLWIGTPRGLNSLSFGSTSPAPGYTDLNSISLFNRQAVLATYKTSSILAVVNLMMPVDATKGDGEKVNSTWLPAYHKVYALVNNTIFTLDNTWGLPATVYHAAAFDDKGFLWIGTRDRGIYRSSVPLSTELLQNEAQIEDKNDFFKPWWSMDTGAPTNQIDNLLWAQEKMWVGTTAGLLALDAESRKIIHHIAVKDGLLANNATSIAISPVSGSLWIGTNQGLAEIDPEKGTVLQTVTKAHGLVDNEVWFYGSVQIDDRGSVYFGTAKGITIYNPFLDKQNLMAPVIRLTGIMAEDVPGERNEFSFEYAALSFGNERQIRYQTRLLGFNDEWSPQKTDTRVNFTNLSAYLFPKTYTLQVRAINESGVWSEEPLSYNFAVMPPGWLSWWASLGYLIIFGIGVFAVDRIQRSRLLKKEREEALLRESELKAEAAIARSKVAEAQAKTLEAENELKASELKKARELEVAYHELKSTQKRLIQAEKMASLGRLSTGIAHEIKNPLNFITNFAELSKELVEELQLAIKNNDKNEIESITKNLSLNTHKIEEHGKRADAIVKSMMQHSRESSMIFEMTNLNDLIIQYAELAYHSKSAKNPELEVVIIKNLDERLQPINLISRQVGQVLQNIIENALDAVLEKKSKGNGTFRPEILISTEKLDKDIEIRISDNGPGIPESVKERIFEPFFTTKPTGEGTGLGLSISYDIITQIHNGSLKVEADTEQGTSFIITLPSTLSSDSAVSVS